MNLDKANDFNRLYAQTEALVIMASGEENIRQTNHQDMANLLWLVQNQLERMKQAFNEALELVCDDQGGEA
jgi:diadenosine tetraphosphate (Ap4A) HIT family hydrolase